MTKMVTSSIVTCKEEHNTNVNNSYFTIALIRKYLKFYEPPSAVYTIYCTQSKSKNCTILVSYPTLSAGCHFSRETANKMAAGRQGWVRDYHLYPLANKAPLGISHIVHGFYVC